MKRADYIVEAEQFMSVIDLVVFCSKMKETTVGFIHIPDHVIENVLVMNVGLDTLKKYRFKRVSLDMEKSLSIVRSWLKCSMIGPHGNKVSLYSISKDAGSVQFLEELKRGVSNGTTRAEIQHRFICA